MGGEHCIPSPSSISVSVFTGFSLPAVGLRWGRREESWTLAESPAPWRTQLGLLPGEGSDSSSCWSLSSPRSLDCIILPDATLSALGVGGADFLWGKGHIVLSALQKWQDCLQWSLVPGEGEVLFFSLLWAYSFPVWCKTLQQTVGHHPFFRRLPDSQGKSLSV